MRWLAEIAFRLKSLFWRRKLVEQLSEEIRTHVGMAAGANVASGMSVRPSHKIERIRRSIALRGRKRVIEAMRTKRSDEAFFEDSEVQKKRLCEFSDQELEEFERHLRRTPPYTHKSLLLSLVIEERARPQSGPA